MSRRTEKLEALFEAALALESVAQQQAYLDRACPDPDLRREVESLLAAHRNPDSLLVPGREAADTRVSVPITEQPGDQIGRYKLLEKLGDGGFGVVYMAEQREPVKRRVALKIIKVGMDTREVVARFEAERQALALMDHPNIAKVFDAGATEGPVAAGVPPAVEPGVPPGGTGRQGQDGQDAPEVSSTEPGGKMPPSTAGRMPAATLSAGRPYFVMELVRGIRITDYCDQNQLGLEERLKLFMQVCHAVQHAHQKGIIHRDLKPSNILVTLHDGVPVPKVIDFGIAKATQQKLTDKTLFTQFAAFIGTPAYMSPEQAAMTSLDIDTRSDIYSLGVLLYELLTGTTPFDAQALLKSGFDEMRRVIRETEPEKPSTRLATRVARGSAHGLRRQDAAFPSPSGNPTAPGVPARSQSGVMPPQSTKSPRALSAPLPAIPALNPQLKSLSTDLDWIVMKCLEKDRARRYETANGLASDLQRHLNNEPVTARPPSAAYRLGKLVRRNKLAFAALVAVSLTLLTGIAASSWQAVRATRARALAERRLGATLRYAEQIAQDVAPELRELIGASKASESLTTNTLALLEQLRADEETSDEFRHILGGLHMRLALILGWQRGNSAWDPEAGLKSALEAIRLLQPRENEKPSDERILQLAEAELVAAGTSDHLQATEDALAHYREMDRWATLITNSPSVGDAARVHKLTAQYVPGWILLRAGRVEEALTNYYLPKLRQLQEHGAPGPSAYLLDFVVWSQTHNKIGIACLKLGRKEEALSHCREALRFMEEVTRRDPNNSEFAGQQAMRVAQLGEALLAVYQPEGLERLKTALESVNTLAGRDPGNVGFRLIRSVVLQYYVQGLTAWAADPAATMSQRRERLEQAQARFEEAEKLIGKLRTESARKAMRFEWDFARTNLAAARAKLEAESSAKP